VGGHRVWLDPHHAGGRPWAFGARVSWLRSSRDRSVAGPTRASWR
jgi:hypothetical protein